MRSFGSGSRVVPASSIEEGMAICAMLDRMDEDTKRRDYLRSLMYGHVFGIFGKCRCGMTDNDYNMLDPSERQICPCVDIKSLGTFRAGDIVRHKPTMQHWTLAIDQHGDHVSWCGFPEGTALAKDVEIVERASDKERHDMLMSWAKQTGNDHRIRHAKATMTQEKRVIT